LNTHFLMPPDITPVELMSCGQTDPAVIQLLVDRLPGYGLTPYVVQRESMGFIFNRVWAAIKRETLAVVAEGVASPEVVDAILCQATGMKPGPFRLMDAVGLDVALSIEDNYAQHRPGLPEEPRILLKKMIDEGRFGVKSGRGFYNYQ
jgi:3-hydroxybutyryl-CoA dehydrogenase